MSHSWRDWSKSDILYGILVPLIVVLIIVALSRVSYVLGFSSLSGAVYGIIMELEELTVIVAVPLVLGLVWNRWAGGASGFLMGGLFALYWSKPIRKYALGWSLQRRSSLAGLCS